jgi:hypothetical protein
MLLRVLLLIRLVLLVLRPLHVLSILGCTRDTSTTEPTRFARWCASTHPGRLRPRPRERGRRLLYTRRRLTGLLVWGERSVQEFHRADAILQICYAFLPMWRV